MGATSLKTKNVISKERVAKNGEVFTQLKHVEDCLDLLNRFTPHLYDDLSHILFEPSCGTGNFLEVIYRKRLDCLYSVALKKNVINPAEYSLTNTINSIWGIDCTEDNIIKARIRILKASFDFLENKRIYIKEDFASHLLTAIKWHIRRSEFFTSLSSPNKLDESAKKSVISKQWIENDAVQYLNFKVPYVKYYHSFKMIGSEPQEFIKSSKLISNYLNGACDLKRICYDD